MAAVRGGLVGILPAGRGVSECLSAGGLDTATQAEVLLAALARSARPPESVTAAGGGRAAAACSRDASWSVEYGASCVVAQGSVERHSTALRVCGAIESCGVRVRSPGPTAGYGKPYVRWCGRVPGAIPVTRPDRRGLAWRYGQFRRGSRWRTGKRGAPSASAGEQLGESFVFDGGPHGGSRAFRGA